MTLSDKQWQFLQDLALLIHYAVRKGYKLTGGELQRHSAVQKIYVQKGLSKTMDSQHPKKLAIDMFLFLDGSPVWSRCDEWNDLGKFWTSLRPENRWGGDWDRDNDYTDQKFNDLNHFEHTD